MNKKQLFFYYCGYYNVLQSMADPSKRDKGSTFLAQSIFCFGSFLAGYLIRNVPVKYLFTETTFIEARVTFSRDYL